MITSLIYSTTDVGKGVFKGGGGFRGFKPPKFSDFFLKSEGKEIGKKRKKRDVHLNIFLGLIFFRVVVEKFSGGEELRNFREGGLRNFRGGVDKFSGGVRNFRGGGSINFRGGGGGLRSFRGGGVEKFSGRVEKFSRGLRNFRGGGGSEIFGGGGLRNFRGVNIISGGFKFFR